MKTKVFNVIVLDKSGSMTNIARQAVDGVNETIGAIKSAQENNPEMEQMVTLVAFCGCELKTIYDNIPVNEVQPLTDRDYRPCCMTPLYDAIGTTVTRIHAAVAKEENALALVTIITDGYENASREFTQTAIKALIQSYKDEGWQFTYIGADHDVEAVAYSLNIRHSMRFDKSEAGTKAMFEKNRLSSQRWAHRMSFCMCAPMSADERRNLKKKINEEDFFDSDD